MATFDPPGLQHLAPVWVNELRRQGVDSDRTLALWRDDHLEPPPPDRIAMLQRWARGETRIVDLTRDEGITHSRVQAMLKDAALRLIAAPGGPAPLGAGTLHRRISRGHRAPLEHRA